MISNLDKRISDSNGAMDRKLDRVLASLVAIEKRGNSNVSQGTVDNVVQTSHLQAAPAAALPPAGQSSPTHQPSGPARDSMPAPPTPSVNRASRPAAGLPAPGDILRHENRDGLIDNLMAREDYAGISTQGKPANNEPLFMKPYMFIEREGVQTIRQKLDLRASLSMIEYISCTLSLLRDSDAYSHSDLHDIIRHLGAVAIDAMVRPWPNVRRWSQHIWDLVERGKCRWSDYQIIQDERFRISYMNLPHQANSATQGPAPARSTGGNQGNSNGAICRDFNSVAGCRFNGTHEDGNAKFVHVCAHCDSIGRRSSHPYHRCRLRMDAAGQYHSGNDSQQDNRTWQNHGSSNHRRHQSGGHSRGQYNGNNRAYETQPKNA